MGTRTVRLDQDAENALQRICKMTGLSISEVLKRGMQTYEQTASKVGRRSAYEIYADLGLQGGGWSLAPSNRAKQSLRTALMKKHRR